MRISLLLVTLLVGCSGPDLEGPYDSVPLDGDFVVGVSRPVHVVRDRFGIAHIDAQTLGDAAFVQGYVMAHDRLPQMDILRRFGAGTLSELFGALDEAVIDTDLEMRVHRMKPLAQEAWVQLQASTAEDDRQVVELLNRFADGVNAYAAAIQSEDNPSGMWNLDPNVLVSFDPIRFTPWDPVDSLVLGRFQAFALSWSAPEEIKLTELYQHLYTTYDLATPADPAAYARRGISRDLVKLAPVGVIATIPEFPNVDADSGTRSDGSQARSRSRSTRTTAARGATRPQVPPELFAHARTFFAQGIRTGAFGSLGPHAFMQPYSGSNNWAVGPSLTQDGSAILASDQHLQLPNPSIFYPTHLIVRDLPPTEHGIDVIGVTFPGIPGVILGSNGHLAWSATVSVHDANDVYLETIAPCAGGSCVAHKGGQVPIETFTEQIDVGVLGTLFPSSARTATYEVVPHHGPIVPRIDKTTHQLVPRTDASALSIAYTGYEPTFEIRALWNMARATTVEEGFRALRDFSFGSQNWTLVDKDRRLGWTTHSVVPDRAPAAYTWNATTNPGGLAPFFVLPGDGSADWEGEMSSRYIPHVIDPPTDYIATSNADPVGATFDGDPLNQPVVDGRPLYVGFGYAPGLRQDRITERIIELGNQITVDDMADLQHDTRSNMGAKTTPRLLATLGRIADPSGMPADFVAHVAALTPDELARLEQARTLLAAWSFATPTGLGEGESTDAAATAVFNAWMHFFIGRVLRDEVAPLDPWIVGDALVVRSIHALLATPETFVQSATTNEPIVCDVLDAAGDPDDSCSKLILLALDDAMTHLASTAAFGTPDVAQWRWGELHRLRIAPLFPNPELELPARGQPGFPKPGDNFAVNRSDQGWSDLDFSQSSDGPAQRFLAIVRPDEPIRVRWSLPGGVIYDSRSPHYRDLLDDYYLAETHFDAPIQTPEIISEAEHRWRFR